MLGRNLNYSTGRQSLSGVLRNTASMQNGGDTASIKDELAMSRDVDEILFHSNGNSIRI